MDNLQEKTFTGIAWKTTQMLSSSGLSFLFMIFMTRLLTPSDYGLIGMLSVFIVLSQAFIDCGFGQALIRKKDRTAVDESTVFYFNITASIVCYLILFTISPWVADFYSIPKLKNILRVSSLTLIISSFSSVQVLLYSIKLDFKTPTLVSLPTNILSGTIGIVLAYKGFGVWALVAQQVMFATFTTIIYIIVSKWHPILSFSKKSFKDMYSFGSKLLGARLLNVFYNKLSPVVIGKYYSAAELGLFSKAEQMASFPCTIVYSSLSSVTYPVLCKMQNDRNRLCSAYRRFIGVTSFLVAPMMILLSVFTEPLLISLFGEQWQDASLYMSIMCLPWMLVPVQILNLNLLQVLGRSDLLLRLEIIGKVIGFSILLIVLPISVLGVCIGYTTTTYICLFVNTYYTGKYIKYTLFEQLRDIFRPVGLAVISAVPAYFSVTMVDNTYIKFCIGMLVGISVYVFLAFIFKMHEMRDFINILKQYIKK